MHKDFVFDDQGILRCQGFVGFVWQNHGFGSRHASHVASVTLRQVHSAVVREANGLADRQAEGDALVTNEPGLAIGVRTADCVPILLLDAHSCAVAAIHAGWRGSASQIVGATIRKLSSLYGSDPADIYAAIGPCIQACCYQVSADVAGQFGLAADQNGKAHLDLAAANKKQMLAAGLLPDHVFDSGLCTHCHPDQFFSFRREPENPGRMLSVISRSLSSPAESK